MVTDAAVSTLSLGILRTVTNGKVEDHCHQAVSLSALRRIKGDQIPINLIGD